MSTAHDDGSSKSGEEKVSNLQTQKSRHRTLRSLIISGPKQLILFTEGKMKKKDDRMLDDYEKSTFLKQGYLTEIEIGYRGDGIKWTADELAASGLVVLDSVFLLLHHFCFCRKLPWNFKRVIQRNAFLIYRC